MIPTQYSFLVIKENDNKYKVQVQTVTKLEDQVRVFQTEQEARKFINKKQII
jgi:hypothetical protein